MTSNRIKFENSYFNPLCNEHFSDTEDERDPDENLFNKANTQNLKCSYLFPNQVENFLSEKESSETINTIHINITSLWTYFDKLLGILDSNCSFNFLCITETYCTDSTLKNNTYLYLPSFDVISQKRKTNKLRGGVQVHGLEPQKPDM